MSCTIPANPDIAGIGVRVSVYIQAVLTLIPALLKIVEDVTVKHARPKQVADNASLEDAAPSTLDSQPGLFKYHHTAVAWDDVSELMNPNLVLGYALIISGIIQAHTFGLSVYHAITILNLNWIIAMSIIPCFVLSENDRLNGEDESFYRKGRYYVGQLVLTGAFGLWLFTNIHSFDKAADNCTSTTMYYIPGKPVNVTHPVFRRFWIAIYSILVAPYINFYFVGLIVIIFIIVGIVALLVPIAIIFVAFYMSHRLRRIMEISLPLIGCSLVVALPQILFLLLTERTIEINDVGSEEGQWTFGQTSALLLALSSVRAAVRQVRQTAANIRRLQNGEIHEMHSGGRRSPEEVCFHSEEASQTSSGDVSQFEEDAEP